MNRLPFRRLAAASCVSIFLGLAGCATSDIPARNAPPQALPPPPPPISMLPPAPPQQALPPPSVDLGGKTDVALLLPLSGPNAALGRDMLDAAELAVSELGGDSLALTPKDTHGTPEGAADAAKAALGDGAKLIIGPLTAPEVLAVKPIVAGTGVSVVAFSNQAKVAGDGVFLLGFLPQESAQRIVAYAHKTGIKRFAVLAPTTSYGQVTAKLLQDAIFATGGQVDQVQYFDPQAMDPRAAIQALAPSGKPEFEALLLTDASGKRLKDVASVLPVYNIAPPDVRLLGTDSWDVPDLGTEPELVGGWFAAAPPEARTGFEQRFRDAYGHAPQRLASLAYDAVGMAAVLQKTPGSSFATTALTNPSGFAGPDGIFRLRPDGTTERGLAVLQVERRGVSTVDPAPETFQAQPASQ